MGCISVADPGFPQGGGANSPGGHQHTILPNFPKNCMKLKEFGSQGACIPHAPLRSAAAYGCVFRLARALFGTLQEHQSILTNATVSKNSEIGLNMVAYEKVFFFTNFKCFVELRKCVANIILRKNIR